MSLTSYGGTRQGLNLGNGDMMSSAYCLVVLEEEATEELRLEGDGNEERKRLPKQNS